MSDPPIPTYSAHRLVADVLVLLGERGVPAGIGQPTDAARHAEGLLRALGVQPAEPAAEVVDEYDGNPIIQLGVRAVRAYAAPGGEGDITRDQAAGVLRLWEHYGELSDREIAAILRRFPDTVPAPPRALPCEHCGLTVPVVGGRYAAHRRPDGTHCRDSGRPVPA